MTTTPTAALVEEAERERTALSLELGTTEYLIAALRRAEAERDAAIARAVNAEQEQADMERLLEMQHERTRQADELWRKQHNKPLTSPDLGALIEWLMKRAEKAEAERDAQHAEVLRLTAERDAAQAKIDRILDPPIKRMNMADGEINVVFDAPEMARIIATTFWDCLDEHKAKNYVEMSFASPESPTKRVVVTVRKLIGRTPEELREAVAKERDLLTEENARLQKERDDALAMETDTARRSSAEIDSLKAELNEAQSETEDLNRRVAELLAQRNEARQEADRRLDMVGDLMRLAWQLRAHIATLELLRRGGK